MLFSAKNLYSLSNNTLKDIHILLIMLPKKNLAYKKANRSLDDLISGILDIFDSKVETGDINYDLQILNFIDINLIQSLKNTPEDQKLFSAVYDHLEIISAGTNNIRGLELYSVEEILTILLNGAEYDTVRLIHTLRQSIGEEYTREYGFVYLEYLQSEKKLNLPLRDGALVQSLMLDNLWKNYGTLPVEGKNFLLTNAYLGSFFVSVPVIKNLQDFLYSTSTPIDFGLESNFLCQQILVNKETFFVDRKQTQEKEFALCIRELTFQLGSQNYEPAVAESYVQKTFSSVDPRYSESLISALDTFFQVKNGTLIEHNVGDEESEVDSLNKDMSKLVQWFSNRADWTKIVEYFKKTKTIVPKDFFLTQLKDTFDFSQDADIQTLSDFSALLLDGGIIQEDLFVFDENKGEFVWNTQVI